MEPVTKEETRCLKCRMTFHIEEPPRGIEHSRCPECSRPMWSYLDRATHNKAKVGMTPEQYADWIAL